MSATPSAACKSVKHAICELVRTRALALCDQERDPVMDNHSRVESNSEIAESSDIAAMEAGAEGGRRRPRASTPEHKRARYTPRDWGLSPDYLYEVSR